MIDIKSYNYNELASYLLNLGEAKFRAKQLFQWIHQKQVNSFSDMTNLSKDFRDKLSGETYLTSLEIVDVLKSDNDGTKKYLFKLHDGHVIETVVMTYAYGYSVCISSQVGCRMGCKFCASTLNGLDRHLSAGEMLEQVYQVERIEHRPCYSVVVMGIGEPFDNYDQLLRFIYNINDSRGRNLGARHITVSTCGIVPKIKAFADLELQVNLAISLHGVDDAKRSALMPINKTYPIDDLLDACQYYIKKTNRRITFEYTVIEGANESLDDAKKLAALLKGFLCHVNLIPINISVNESMEQQFVKPSQKTVKAFKDILEMAHIPVTIRRSLGDDIKASCGQLKHKHSGQN